MVQKDTGLVPAGASVPRLISTPLHTERSPTAVVLPRSDGNTGNPGRGSLPTASVVVLVAATARRLIRSSGRVHKVLRHTHTPADGSFVFRF